jgi:hypothetical protein
MTDFLAIYKLYRKGGHRPIYCLRTAWRIAVQGLPF